MTLNLLPLFDKIKALAKLGRLLSSINTSENNTKHDNVSLDAVKTLVWDSIHHNAWFTPENIRICFAYWGSVLTEKNLHLWFSAYKQFHPKDRKTIGLVLAGNIPMVGFHDILCVLMSGHRFIAKCSSSDNKLIPAIMNLLCEIEPLFAAQISFSDTVIRNADAFISTGNNNSSRYFDFYFGKYPHIIRKNRNSVAILTGQENLQQLELLGDDILCYFGLGCRNVSKIYVPQDYDFQLLFSALEKWNQVRFHHKYSNNYEYNKAIFLVNGDNFLDNGFLLLKQEKNINSPISVLFYDYYLSIEDVVNQIAQNEEHIQCVVSALKKENFIPFGQAQKPKLQDYADNIDTLHFLLKL